MIKAGDLIALAFFVFFNCRVKLMIERKRIIKMIRVMNLHEIEMLIKDRLCDAIKTSGLTLTQIADAVGVSIATISYYKNKEKLPTIPTFAVLCIVLDISADEILGLPKY